MRTLQENQFHLVMGLLFVGSLFVDQAARSVLPTWRPPDVSVFTLVLAMVWLGMFTHHRSEKLAAVGLGIGNAGCATLQQDDRDLRLHKTEALGGELPRHALGDEQSPDDRTGRRLAKQTAQPVLPPLLLGNHLTDDVLAWWLYWRGGW